jgi:hypothetical protein
MGGMSEEAAVSLDYVRRGGGGVIHFLPRPRPPDGTFRAGWKIGDLGGYVTPEEVRQGDPDYSGLIILGEFPEV